LTSTSRAPRSVPVEAPPFRDHGTGLKEVAAPASVRPPPRVDHRLVVMCLERRPFFGGATPTNLARGRGLFLLYLPEGAGPLIIEKTQYNFREHPQKRPGATTPQDLDEDSGVGLAPLGFLGGRALGERCGTPYLGPVISSTNFKCLICFREALLNSSHPQVFSGFTYIEIGSNDFNRYVKCR